MNKFRYAVEISEDGNWHKMNFSDIKFGMIFKLFEPDGKPVIRSNNASIFAADTDAYQLEDGLWSVALHDYSE